MGREEYNQISGSSVTLNYIPAANLPSVRKKSIVESCSAPPPPPPISFSHITKWPSFALPWSYSTGKWIFNVRKADLSRWPLKYSKNENKTQHQYFSQPLLTVCMYPCSQETPLRKTPKNVHMHPNRCRRTICIFMNCCAMFTQAAWSHRDLEGPSKGISHIVTFSWNRRAQIEDEWQAREQMRMCLRRREQFLGMSGFQLAWETRVL